MGKIRRARQKLHLPAVKPDKEKDKQDVMKPNESSLPAIFPTAGLFDANVDEADSSQAQKVQHNKKDRRKERHEQFLKKLHAGRRVEEDSKKAKQRAQTVVVGDMEPLLSALPTINIPELVRSTKSTDNSGGSEKPKKKNKMRNKARQALQASEIAHFQQVLQHPAYKANPLAAISEHIKNAVQRERESQT
ncbi:hypothetical protein ABFA07_007268 [Porites harrisoni]